MLVLLSFTTAKSSSTKIETLEKNFRAFEDAKDSQIFQRGALISRPCSIRSERILSFYSRASYRRC